MEIQKGSTKMCPMYIFSSSTEEKAKKYGKNGNKDKAFMNRASKKLNIIEIH
jgi:hypothetical protein